MCCMKHMLLSVYITVCGLHHDVLALYVNTGAYPLVCDCACVRSRSAGSKDQRLAGQRGRKQDMAALNFEKSQKERVTRLNTYTCQGVLA